MRVVLSRHLLRELNLLWYSGWWILIRLCNPILKDKLKILYCNYLFNIGVDNLTKSNCTKANFILSKTRFRAPLSMINPIIFVKGVPIKSINKSLQNISIWKKHSKSCSNKLKACQFSRIFRKSPISKLTVIGLSIIINL